MYYHKIQFLWLNNSLNMELCIIIHAADFLIHIYHGKHNYKSMTSCFRIFPILCEYEFLYMNFAGNKNYFL